MHPDTVLEVSGLSIEFRSKSSSTTAVSNLSFQLSRGKTLGIVGESGSGKSVSALSIMRLIGENGVISAGRISLRTQQEETVNILTSSEKQMQKIRGRQIGMIFQEPMSSLNPVHRCGEQVAEAIRLHLGLDRKSAKERVLELFREVDLPDVETIYRAYPHKLSGGQKQRVMIAMAISCNPSILIADEPTTALDVTVQQRIIDLLRRLQTQHQMSIIFITHDLGVVAELADDVLVMKKGKMQELAPIEELFSPNPKRSIQRDFLPAALLLPTDSTDCLP